MASSISFSCQLKQDCCVAADFVRHHQGKLTPTPQIPTTSVNTPRGASEGLHLEETSVDILLLVKNMNALAAAYLQGK